jgi:hypothetical protein
LFLEKNTYVIMRALGIEEQVGTLRFSWKVFTITSTIFNLCPTFEWEWFANEGITFVGFCCWMMSYHTHSQLVGSMRGNQKRFDPLKSLFLNCEVLQVEGYLVEDKYLL